MFFQDTNIFTRVLFCPCFSLVKYCDLPRTFELLRPTPSTTTIANALRTMTFHHSDVSWGEVTKGGLFREFQTSGWWKPHPCLHQMRISTLPRFWPAKFLFQPGLQDEESVIFKRVSRSYDMCCVTLAAPNGEKKRPFTRPIFWRVKSGLAVNEFPAIANGRMTLYSKLGKIQHRTLRANKYLITIRTNPL